MTEKKYQFHNSKGGAALAVRVTPRSRENQITEVMDNGTIRIRLTASPEQRELNQALVNYLAEVLGVSPSKIEIVAGESGREKLVSILDLDAQSVQKRVLSQMS